MRANESVYEMSVTDVLTSDGSYHRVQLTRHGDNVSLTVDDFTSRTVTGAHIQTDYVSK